MRMNIDIRVNVPEGTMAEQRLDFLKGVMELFRNTFPQAEPLPPLTPEVPPAVTVSFQNDDGTPMDSSYKGGSNDS